MVDVVVKAVLLNELRESKVSVFAYFNISTRVKIILQCVLDSTPDGGVLDSTPNGAILDFSLIL